MRAEVRLLIVAAALLLTAGSVDAGGTPLRFGLAVEGLPRSTEVLADLEREVGLPVSLLNVFLQWPADPASGEFPLATAHAAEAHGATLCLTWEPMFLENGREHAIPAEDILSGRYDDYILRFARAAASVNAPLILRFGHEMNLARYHWGGTAEAYGPDSPGRFREMFRHVVHLFRHAGASLVTFAFCPNMESLPNPTSSPEAAWNTAKAYYPGDDVVDLLGMDGYNWGTTQSRATHGWQSQWRDFENMFASLYAELRALNPSAPLYVFETSCAAQGGDKAQWLRDALATSRHWGLEGLIWFQANKEVDWRLRTGIAEHDVATLRRALLPVP